MAKRDIVAISGSAGSTPVIKRLLQDLPPDFPGSLFVTTHVPASHPSYLPDLLQQVSAIPVRAAVDGQPIEPGRDARASGRTAVAELYEGRVGEYRRYADKLREAALMSLRTSRDALDGTS